MIVTGITENIKLNNLDGYYSDLVNLYKDTVVAITELDSKIREYKANVSDLRIPIFEEESKLEEKRIIILQSINKLIEDTEGTLNSYYEEKYNKFIDVIVPVHIVSSGKEKIIILLGIALSVILSLLGSYIKEFFIKKWIRD